MFLYIQPRRVWVQGNTEESRPYSADHSFEHWDADIDSAYGDALGREVTPTFVAATERFAEQAKVTLARAADADWTNVSLDSGEARVLDETVGRIKAIVAKYAATERGAGR
jgi:hypothetical protein